MWILLRLVVCYFRTCVSNCTDKTQDTPTLCNWVRYFDLVWQRSVQQQCPLFCLTFHFRSLPTRCLLSLEFWLGLAIEHTTFNLVPIGIGILVWSQSFQHQSRFLSFLIWLRESQGFFCYDPKIASWGNIPLLHLDWTPGQWELLATLLQIFDSPNSHLALKQPTATIFLAHHRHPGARISASNLSFREGFKAQSDLIKSILIAIIIPVHQTL